MQAHRGYTDKLEKMLAEPNDAKQILEMCAGEHESDSNGAVAVSSLAHKVTKLKDAWNSTKQPDTD